MPPPVDVAHGELELVASGTLPTRSGPSVPWLKSPSPGSPCRVDLMRRLSTESVLCQRIEWAEFGIFQEFDGAQKGREESLAAAMKSVIASAAVEDARVRP